MGHSITVSRRGDALVVALQGVIDLDAVRERHATVKEYLGIGRSRSVVYDIRQALCADEGAHREQQRLNEELLSLVDRLAILVSDTKLAFRARLAFSSLPSQVFYDDLDAALAWTVTDHAGS